ncbi:hypothetical protein [Lysinibacillus sp. NPDC047702]|uniref:hypothetical protein n=1 Tax=unclassified Lysinibacillus TaxID=2636778 RepID=UPI003CFFF018
MEEKDLIGFYAIQLKIIDSLDKSKEKWFSILEKSLDNEELRNTCFEEINEIDAKLMRLERIDLEVISEYIDLLNKKIKRFEKKLKKLKSEEDKNN